MKLNDKYNLSAEFEDLFAFQSKDEVIEHESKMIMFRFLSELEKLNDSPIKRKDLAKALDTSPSYITQLFRGDKLINLTMLAKIQDVFNITFEISAKSNVTTDYDVEVNTSAKLIPFKSNKCLERQLFSNVKTPDYTRKELVYSSNRTKIAQ